MAALDPAALVVGLDAVAAPMAETSRRAARPAGRGGLPNALFVVTGIETPPPELAGLADTVTVDFPWGSLLRGLVGLDARATAGLGGLVRPGGRVEALVSVAGRDGLAEIAEAIAGRAGLAEAWARLGFAIEELRPAGPAEMAARPSTWAKRLGVGSQVARPVTRLVLRRLPSPGPDR